jgi:hypothetical protein
MWQPPKLLCAERVINFCANRFLLSFYPPTKELYHGKESQEGNEKESEEEVILSLRVAT